MVARATASVERLDAKLEAAKSSGELQNFNREFRRRVEAEARRQPFPRYDTALAVAGTATADLVRTVFESVKFDELSTSAFGAIADTIYSF